MPAIKFLIIIAFNCIVCISCIIAAIQGKTNKNIIKSVFAAVVIVNLFVVLMIFAKNNLIEMI